MKRPTVRVFFFSKQMKFLWFQTIIAVLNYRHRPSKNEPLAFAITARYCCAVCRLPSCWVMTSATVTAAGGSKARHDGGCRDRKIVRWGSAAND